MTVNIHDRESTRKIIECIVSSRNKVQAIRKLLQLLDNGMTVGEAKAAIDHVRSEYPHVSDHW